VQSEEEVQGEFTKKRNRSYFGFKVFNLMPLYQTNPSGPL
jgi:hypothetical protein